VRKREVLDQLSERLSDLAEFAAAGHGNGAEEEDTSEGEDILADIIVTPSESMDSTRSPDMPPEEPDESLAQTAEPLEPPSPPPQPRQRIHTAAPQEPSNPSNSPPATTTTQTLRPRHPEPTTTTSPPPAATTTSSLFTNHTPKPTTTTTATATATEEAILDHHRQEQDALSESILKLASELKASSQAFSAALEEDKEVVDRAGKGMSKTEQAMEGVTRRMGMLTRMTEGEGWWGRMRLYVVVYGLMVLLVLLVGVGPKLRF
jgi:outer membrane biosynthesis protein TonB